MFSSLGLHIKCNIANSRPGSPFLKITVLGCNSCTFMGKG